MKIKPRCHVRKLRITRSGIACTIASATLASVCPVSNAAPKQTGANAAASPLANDAFPIAVWLQDPKNASRYQNAGINLYVGLWQGPTEAQLATLKAAGMPVICGQNAVGLAHKNDPTIVAWMHDDEPDNAQPAIDPATGKQDGWGPCVPPPKIVKDYGALRAADPTRPIMLNLGCGVAYDEWIGRGSGASLSDYDTYVKGCDIVSFDVYPVAGVGMPDKLWYVPKGVDRLVKWTGGKKPVWSCIECTNFDGKAGPTPSQVRSEVWMAIIHGANGLIYFVHQFKPTFDETALLDDPQMLSEVTSINKQIRNLTPVLKSPGAPDAASVTSSNAAAPIDLLVKRKDGATYIFAAGMRSENTSGAFMVRGIHGDANVEVLGENRAITAHDGKFTDDFKPFGVHIYRIR